MADSDAPSPPASSSPTPSLRAVPTSLGLGERLRSTRKARALSVAQVAEALRLEEPSIIALEEGRFDALGAPVFVRGHLRRYAALLELDPNAVLEAYRAAAPGSDAPQMLTRARPQDDYPAAPVWLWWVLAAILLAGGLFIFSRNKEVPGVEVGPPPVLEEALPLIPAPSPVEALPPEAPPASLAAPPQAPAP
jgi:cytoskeleton protein RodZ